MSAPIVSNILHQVNQLPPHVAASVKKLLYLKLEVELSQKRCVIEGEPYKKLPDDHVHDVF